MSWSARRFRPLKAARAHARALTVPVAVLILLSGCATVRGSADPATVLEEESPLIERVTFQGREGLPVAEVRAAVFTQQTRCRGTFLLKPLCLTRWSTLIDEEYLDREELPKDALRLEVLYFRRGFRQASVGTEVVPHKRGVEVIFTITEGPPTVVGSFQVSQTEEILTSRQIRRALLPGEGERLDLVRLEAALFELESRLGQRGYLDAEARDQVDLSEDRLTASLSVVIDPQRRSTLGELDIQGNEGIEDRTISEAVRLRSGRVLRSGDLVGSQRSLYESNLFHEARVDLPPQADSAKRLEITVREAPPRSARAGLGFNTVDFLQVDGRYLHYNFRGRGRRMDAYATVGNLFARQLSGSGIFRALTPSDDDAFFRPTWQAGAELLQPGFLSADNRVGFGLFAHRRTIPAVVVDEGFGASASVTRRLDFETPVSLEYRFESSAVHAGDLYFCGNYGICDLSSIASLRGRHRLSPVGLALFSDHADDPLAPKSGFRARLELEHASALTLSDFRYNRVTGEGSVYLPLGLLRRKVLSGRLRVGWVGALAGTSQALGFETDGLALLHPRRRFFAGGSRSVRGFGENQLGPMVLTVDPAALTGGDEPLCTPEEVSSGSCDPSGLGLAAFQPRPLGGRAVLEGSVEMRFPLFGGFQGAAFVDGGLVKGGSALTSKSVAAVTPGIGFRYHSPVAPIRVDLGWRPRLAQSLPVLTEVVDANGERRLVRLSEPRLYDPVGEAVGGGFRRFMAKLRLHVSIGEAF
jgi:outer membrane protein assembly factor BamA